MTEYIINGAISVEASLAANKISDSFGKRKSKKQHVVCRLIGTPEDKLSCCKPETGVMSTEQRISPMWRIHQMGNMYSDLRWGIKPDYSSHDIC